MSNDIKTTEVESTQPQTQEKTVSNTRKDARHIIRTHILDAVADLGGKAQGGAIKEWILNKVGAKVEDFGRTPENKKYPNGRYAFVECYTHIQRDMKKQGHLFTPAWGWVSLTEGDTVSVDGKTLSKPKKTAEATRKVESEATEEAQAPTETLSTEEIVIEADSEEVTPIAPQTSDDHVAENPQPTVLERVRSLTEPHFISVDNKAVLEAYVDVEKLEIVEDDGSGLWRKSLSEVEDGYILSIDDVVEEYVLEEWKMCEQESFEVQPFGTEVKAEIDPFLEVRIGYDKEGREWTRPVDALPEEYNTPITEESVSLKSQEYILSNEVEDDEVEEVEEVIEQKASQEYVVPFVTKDDLWDDEDDEDDGETEVLKKKEGKKLEELELEEEDEALKLLLSKVTWDNNDVWGEIKDGFVYLADEEKPVSVLKFEAHTEDTVEGKKDNKRVTHTQKLRTIASKGLPAYVEAMIKVKNRFKQFSDKGDPRFKTHAQDEFNGCFGNAKTDTSTCTNICPISMLCSNAQVLNL
tara:strand:- start:2503 stop:4074 length:1572 start_codon:yes stop_codon:yes gene_type:complete